MKKYALLLTLLALLCGAAAATPLPVSAACILAVLACCGNAAFVYARRIDCWQSAAHLEVSLLQDAATTSQRDSLQNALRLAQSGERGAAYLAKAPWYVMLGGQGQGGRTLLQQSGWQWHTPAPKPGAVGIGSFDLHLAEQGVVLRPHLPAQVGPWEQLGASLRRNRPLSPLNGVVILLSISELATASELALREHASEARDALDAVYAAVQGTPPVYVMFTKFDALTGFCETFAALPFMERQNAWGRTFVWRGESTRERLSAAWQAFAQDTHAHLANRLRQSDDLEARTAVFHFPDQLARLQGAFEAWGSVFLVPRAERPAPKMRGLYGTSGAQQNTDTPYFVRGALGSMLSRDTKLAVTRPRVSRFLKAGSQTLTLLMALALVALPLWAYQANARLLRSAKEGLQSIASERLANDNKLVPPESLDALQRQVDVLEGTGIHAPWLARHTGMVQAQAVAPKVRAYYYKLLREELMAPMLSHDVQQLSHLWQHYARSGQSPTGSEYKLFFDRVKAHLLLTAPGTHALQASDEAWLANVFAARWANALGTEVSAPQRERMRQHVAAFLAQHEPGDLAFLHDAAAVRNAQTVLSHLNPADAILEQVLADAETHGVGLLQLLGEASVPLEGNARVRGGFTRAGWENVVQARLPALPAQTEGWVLGAKGEEAINRTLVKLGSRGIYRLYWQRYTDAWREFLSSLKLVPPRNPDDALAMVRALTAGEPPPYRRLLQAVSYNTDLDSSGHAPGAASPFADLLKAGVASKDPAVQEVQILPLDIYEQQLGLLRIALEAYVAEPIADDGLRRQLQAAYSTVHDLSQRMQQATSREVVRSLFAMPINMIRHTVLLDDDVDAG